MKRSLIFLFVFSFGFAIGQAPRKTTVQFGETIRMTLKNYFFNMDIIGRDETGVYGIQMPAREVYSGTVLGGIKNYHLARYDSKTMTDPQLFEMKLTDDDKERDFEFATQIGKEFYIFSSFQNRKLKKTFLFAQTVNKKELGLNKDLKKVAEVDWSGESKYDRATFGYRFSPDKSKLMIRYNLLNKENEVVRFGICAMDKSFQQLWQNDSPIPVRGGAIFNFRKFYIDNQGDVYILGILFKTEKEMEKTTYMRKKNLLSSKRMVQREPNYVHQVIAYSNKGKTVSDFVVEEEGKFITDMYVGVNEKQELLFTGFYADDGTVSVKGAFLFRAPKGSKTISKKTYHPFDNEFILKDLPEKEKRNVLDKMADGEEFDKYQYAIDEIQFHDNGTFSMVAEQYFEQSQTVRSGNMVSTQYSYADDNIIILTFKADGSLAWKQKIAKNQMTVSVNRAYAGYALLTHKNKMYFVFNDIPKGNPKKCKAISVEVASDGSLTREELTNPEEKKIVQPLTYKLTADKELCMFGLEGRNYTLARLSFN
jgi:hypothetical protein